MNIDEGALIREALRHAADHTQPDCPSHAYIAVASALASKLNGLSDLERVKLLRPYATDAAHIEFYDHVVHCAGWQLMREASE